MTAMTARDARASLLVGLCAETSFPSKRRVGSQDYSFFDHVDHGRAASDYSHSRAAKGADTLRKALYLLVILCL